MTRTLFLAVAVLALLGCSIAPGATTGPVAVEGPAPLPSHSATPQDSLPAATGESRPLRALRVHFVDVGQGDATLIQTPDGKTVLIDGGDWDTGIVQYLHSVGIRRIDVMIATHPHADHIGGLVQVLEAMPAARVIDNGQPYTTPTYEHFLDEVAASGARYLAVKRGDSIAVGDITLLVLHPTDTPAATVNENSLVLRFKYANTAVLLMGDAGLEAETDLLAAEVPLKADILKVGHHGARYGSTVKFLRAVAPATAVYFAGVNNDYHYPAAQTITALRSVGATVYGTDVDGTIVVTIDESGATVLTSKK